MRKGEIMRAVLESLEQGVEDIADLFIAYLNAGYGASVSKIDYERRKLAKQQTNRDLERKAKQRFHNFIYMLQKDGLISKNKRKFVPVLTNKGKAKLKRLKKERRVSVPFTDYSRPKGDQIVIFIFDIPERERWKRRWVRQALKVLDFSLVQKSVWVGRGRLPKQFLDDLFKLKIWDYVEIFEVGKVGTLKKMKLR